MWFCPTIPICRNPSRHYFEPSEGYELEARLDELDHGYRECHARLARLDPTAAETADWISAKFDVLKDALLAQRRTAGNGLRRTRVSLAVTGIGFEYATRLSSGQSIAVHVIVLEGNHESFMAYATVRNCRAENDGFWIGAEFESLSAEHQRRLSRHIFRLR